MVKQSNRSGFTLLELLIVVIIVSILAALALPRFARMTKRARSSEAATAVGAILTAELVYYQENTKFIGGTLPLTDLLVDVSTVNFGYVATSTGTTSVKVVATGAATATTGITVTGTLSNDGTQTAQIVTVQ